MTKKAGFLDIEHFRKKAPSLTLKPLAIAVAAVLAGCSAKQEEVVMVESVDDCVARTNLGQEQCEIAYQRALQEAQRTGPKYSSRYLCENDFGVGRCNQSGSFFTPFMTGFLVSSLLDSFSASRSHYHYVPAYSYYGNSRDYYGRILTGDGTIVGWQGSRNQSFRVRESVLTKPAPTVTKTVSRGGFGSTASAKSSWGGGKSKGWGG